jgi:hypothetical protein
LKTNEKRGHGKKKKIQVGNTSDWLPQYWILFSPPCLAYPETFPGYYILFPYITFSYGTFQTNISITTVLMSNEMSSGIARLFTAFLNPSE